jgi:hypothetical protein
VDNIQSVPLRKQPAFCFRGLQASQSTLTKVKYHSTPNRRTGRIEAFVALPTNSEYLIQLRERAAEADRLVESAKRRGDPLQQREAEKLLAEWRRMIAKADGTNG